MQTMLSQAWCRKGRVPGSAMGRVARTSTAWLDGRKHPTRLMLHGTTAVWVASLLSACVSLPADSPDADTGCRRVIHADVVAIEQAYVLNRFAAFVPAGMLYALRHDVVAADASRP